MRSIAAGRLAAGVGSLALALTAVCALAPGCSLGLDKALIGEDRDGAAGDSGGPKDGAKDGVSGDAPAEATADSSGAGDGAEAGEMGEGGGEAGPATTCTRSSDCTSGDGCLTGRCLMPAGTCVFDLCPASMCNGYACDPSTHTCGPATPYTFQAAAIALGAGVACPLVSDCVAASFPFVYVGTTQGVYAVNVSDPALVAAPVVPVAGVPFFPTSIVQSGARVYFVGALQASGATSFMVPLAWIDPPADPTLPLQATSVFAVYPASTFRGGFAGGDGGLFVESDPMQGPLDALLVAPLGDPLTVTLFGTPLGMPAETVVGASLGNLVTFFLDPMTYDANFALVTGAGSANALNNGEQDVTAAGFGRLATYMTFGTGPDGSVMLNASRYQVAQDNYSDVRFGWVLADGTQTTFSGQFSIVESYVPPAGSQGLDTPIQAPLAGPVAWLDPERALVLAAAHEATGDTSVQVVSRAMVQPALLPPRAVLPTPTNATGAAGAGSTTSTDSFGYVLTADSPSAATVHIYAPDCMP